MQHALSELAEVGTDPFCRTRLASSSPSTTGTAYSCDHDMRILEQAPLLPDTAPPAMPIAILACAHRRTKPSAKYRPGIEIEPEPLNALPASHLYFLKAHPQPELQRSCSLSLIPFLRTSLTWPDHSPIARPEGRQISEPVPVPRHFSRGHPPAVRWLICEDH